MLESTNPSCPYCPYIQKGYEWSGPMRKREKRIALRMHLQTEHPDKWEKLQRILEGLIREEGEEEYDSAYIER